MKRNLDDRVETYSELINGNCSCGEPVVKVLGSSCTAWKNGDRFHYPEETSAWCIFSCRKCRKPIDETFTPKNTEAFEFVCDVINKKMSY